MRFNFLFLHFLVFGILVFYLSQSNLNHYSFFGIFKNIVENKILHLLHTSIFIHFLIFFTNGLSILLFGPLSESERSFYNNRIHSIFSDLLMVISIFPNDLKMQNVLYFTFIYNFRSLSLIYAIKSKTVVSYRMLFIGYVWLGFSILFEYICCVSLSRAFSIVVLYALDYLLIGLKILEITSLLLIDLQNLQNNRTFVVFIISIIYQAIKAIIILCFIIYVTLKSRFPINSVRSLFNAISKLHKKTILFINYLKLCESLDKLPEVNINSICAICRDSLERGKLLPCNHGFHTDCLKAWCEHESTCPVCRGKLVITIEKKIITEDEVIFGVPISSTD